MNFTVSLSVNEWVVQDLLIPVTAFDLGCMRRGRYWTPQTSYARTILLWYFIILSRIILQRLSCASSVVNLRVEKSGFVF